MSVSKEMIAKFNAPRVTLRGSKMLWGRRFKRTYNLHDEVDAAKCKEAYERLSYQYENWKIAKSESAGNPDRWPTAGHWFEEVICGGNAQQKSPKTGKVIGNGILHKHRDPCTFLKVIRHRK